MDDEPNPHLQAHAPASRPFDAAAFAAIEETELRWLGMAGFLVNARGTTIMIDPLLGDFDMPVLIDFPIAPEQVPHLDAVLVTHSDNDHFSVPTCRRLAPVTGEYHSTRYVDGLMRAEGLPSVGHDIGDRFRVGEIEVQVTPADHAWQNESPAPRIARSSSRTAAGSGSRRPTAPCGHPATRG